MRNKLDTSPEALAEELLGRPYDELDEEEQRALCRVASTEVELDPDEFEVVQSSTGDRLADAVARVGGSWGFIIVFTVILVSWMLINGPLSTTFGIVWDEYPYIFLNLMLSTIAGGHGNPYLRFSSVSRLPAFTSIRIGSPFDFALRTTCRKRSWVVSPALLMLPGSCSERRTT